MRTRGVAVCCIGGNPLNCLRAGRLHETPGPFLDDPFRRRGSTLARLGCRRIEISASFEEYEKHSPRFWKYQGIPPISNEAEVCFDLRVFEPSNSSASLRSVVIAVITAAFLLQACSTPTLVQVARRRQATAEDYSRNGNVKDDVRVQYSITDLDVLNFTDEVKRKLANRSSFHRGLRYGSAGTQATLGALAGAAQVIGWGVSTASGLGLGATYIFGMGQIFNAKGNAQAYEQAFTEIQAAEARFYFKQLGMRFTKADGRSVVDPENAGQPRSGIPSAMHLTPEGETLYYRVSKILKVLHDTLAGKIPDLQDLKEANGESSG